MSRDSTKTLEGVQWKKAPEITFERITGSMQLPKWRAVEAAWLPGGYCRDLGEMARLLTGGQTIFAGSDEE